MVCRLNERKSIKSFHGAWEINVSPRQKHFPRPSVWWMHLTMYLWMATHTHHAVQHERRFLRLAHECTDYGRSTLCCCLRRAERVFCFLFEVCAFFRGSSSLCFISGSVASNVFLWFVICVHTWRCVVILLGHMCSHWRHANVVACCTGILITS